MPLINCKVELSLKSYIVYCLVQELLTQNFLVTLKTEDNAKLSILLNEGFKRYVSWNKYKIILKDYNNE